VKAAGLSCVAFCSGKDDPIACKNLAASLGVRLCLDVEGGIRGNGPRVQDWLNAPVGGSGREPIPNSESALIEAGIRIGLQDPTEPRTTGRRWAARSITSR
jgi:hypothetical protein